jgi:ribulose-phosphate 3-epimerase
MAVIVPTVLAADPKQYRSMMQRAENLSSRVHVDICDGQFADAQTVNLAQVNAPQKGQLDLHLMLQNPANQLETALSHQPHLIIFHYESSGDLHKLIAQTRELGIQTGLAILGKTPVDVASTTIKIVDHVLIFTGHLGHNGGLMQTDQLPKITQVKALKPEIEVSVDGGITPENAAAVVSAGADVLYVGGYIQAARNPAMAWQALEAAL